jgi:hypothetical protein
MFEHNADTHIASLQVILEFLFLLCEVAALHKYRRTEWHAAKYLHIPYPRHVRQQTEVVSPMDIVQTRQVERHKWSSDHDVNACNGASLWKGEAIPHEFQILQFLEFERVKSER